MKKMLLALLLIPSLAQAQQYEQVTVTLAKKALDCERAAANDIGKLQAQLDEATHERDSLRAEVVRLHEANPPERAEKK